MKDNEFKSIVKNGFNQASQGYDNPAMRFFDFSAKHLVESLALKGHEHLLDVATGTGKVALTAAAHLTTGKVVGIDLSDGMLERAKQKAVKAGLDKVSFRCEDIDQIDLGLECFDGILCGFGVFFFADMHALLSKLIRSLKPGGFIAITSFADGSFRPLSDLTLDRFKKYGIKMPDSYTWQRLDSHQKHGELFNAVGLRNIHTHTKPMGYYLKDEREWWDIVYYTGFRSFLNQLSDENMLRYQQELLEEVRNTSEAKGIRLNVDVIFTVAYKQ